MVKQHWKAFVHTLQRHPLSLTLIALIFAMFSIRYWVLIFFTILFIVYYRKHIIYSLFICGIILFCRVMLNLHEIDEDFEGNGLITEIRYYDNVQVNTLSTKYHKFIFFSQRHAYDVGHYVYVEATYRPSIHKTRPFGFDERNYHLGQNIDGSLDVSYIEPIEQRFSLMTLRYDLLRRVETLKSSSIIKALWFGEDDALNTTLLSSLNILFLFKVTGLHIYTFLRILKKYFITNQKVYDMVYLFVLLFFWYLQAWHVTIFRYIILWLIYRVLKRFNIKLHAVLVLLIAFNIHIILSPYLIFNDGFIIGYTIVLFIRVLRPLISLKGSFYYWILSTHIAFILSIWTHEINIMSLILMPLYVFLMSGILFLGTIVVMIIPLFDTSFNQLYISFIRILEVVDLIDLKIYVQALSSIFLMCLLIGLFWMMYSKRYIHLVMKMYMIMLIFLLSFISFQVSRRTTIYMLDVGQGDGLVIQSQGCITVVDAFEGVSETLRGLGTYEIDYLFLTHNDLDHTKEKDELIKTYKIDYKLTAPFQDIPGFSSISASHEIECGDVYIKPLISFIDYEDDNSNSLVLKLYIQNYEMLLMGDATKETEKDLIRTFKKELPSDILKVGHHGSYTSTSEAFLNIVKPQYALISVGRDNYYGMPHQEVIKRLRDIHSFIYRTDLFGTIQLEFTSQGLKILTYAP